MNFILGFTDELEKLAVVKELVKTRESLMRAARKRYANAAKIQSTPPEGMQPKLWEAMRSKGKLPPRYAEKLEQQMSKARAEAAEGRKLQEEAMRQPRWSKAKLSPEWEKRQRAAKEPRWSESYKKKQKTKEKASILSKRLAANRAAAAAGEKLPYPNTAAGL